MEESVAPSTLPQSATTVRTWISRTAKATFFLLIALPLTWICFAGEMVHQSGLIAVTSVSVDYDQDWEHGWPYVFLEREYLGPGSSPLAFDEGSPTFSWTWLLADLLIYVGLLSLLLWLCCAKRVGDRGRFSFSLRTALVGTTLLSLLMANVSNCYLQSQREAEIGRQLKSEGQLVLSKYIGPRWFSRLGLDEITPLKMEGIELVRIRSDELSEEQLTAIYSKLAELSRLSYLHFGGSALTDEEVGRLLAARQRWPIRKLWIFGPSFRGHSLENVRSLPSLVELRIFSSGFDDKGFSAISQWSSLEGVCVPKTSVTAEAVQLAAKMPNLRYVDFYDTEITEEDCEVLEERGIEYGVGKTVNPSASD
ncbi:hypothetical protein LOC68_22850 [Blastopirellula sp. JC732]|uniref:Leucine Rich repeats (2 copies) n=1 Tax=Blastopirellula sediminis TaxID=2894196 RepID=A0A9X1SIG5_9BACT|nr:hypothetical protein [Blastopirellula sediminis]MCC9605458.1 hypothetical protein [Blastopirellula sediminis]MCC9631242.1 hypothetical protein [Blastopirellula sediminis]